MNGHAFTAYTYKHEIYSVRVTLELSPEKNMLFLKAKAETLNCKNRENRDNALFFYFYFLFIYFKF